MTEVHNHIFGITDLQEGLSFSFVVTISEEDLDKFAAVSGDCNPLHMDKEFARQRGFGNRVAHGMLLGAYVSRMVGVYCPGREALLQTVSLKFLSPVYVNDTIRIQAVVHQLSAVTNTLVLKLTVENAQTGLVYVRGKAQVGFTFLKDCP